MKLDPLGGGLHLFLADLELSEFLSQAGDKTKENLKVCVLSPRAKGKEGKHGDPARRVSPTYD